jgi:hypothetical protein
MRDRKAIKNTLYLFSVEYLLRCVDQERSRAIKFNCRYGINQATLVSADCVFNNGVKINASSILGNMHP